jgi:hypothetical protein
MFNVLPDNTTDLELVAAAAVKFLRTAGGFSIKPETLAEPDKAGYMVSLKGWERKFPLTDATEATIAQYFKDTAEERRITGAFAGGWIHGDSAYLDLSVQVMDRAEAEALGARHGQKAIFDLTNETSIYL